MYSNYCITHVQALQEHSGGGVSAYPGVQVGGTATGAMIFWEPPCNNKADDTTLIVHCRNTIPILKHKNFSMTVFKSFS